MGRGVGSLLRGEHAEAVVVLGGEDHIFHARVGGGLGPFFGVETFWVESSV